MSVIMTGRPATLAARYSAAASAFAGIAGCSAARRRFYASAPSSSTSNSASQASTSSSTSSNVDWPTYLALRRSRQIAGLATTVPTTLLSLIASGSYFLTLELDPSHSLGGIDPVFIYSAATISCTGIGWLMGPTIGSLLWNLRHRRLAEGIAQKDRDFHDHVRRWRVDPQKYPPSVQNRLPDYYAEKVSSLAQYRKWLREQAIFKRKVAHGLDD